MQTFLPYPSPVDSASILDYRRLGKQRLEARGIYFLENFKLGNDLRQELEMSSAECELIIRRYWNHPASLMWADNISYLAFYYNTICLEWMSRGYNHNLPFIPVENPSPPWWLGHEPFHSAHRAALLAKAPGYYSKFNWTENPTIDYWWPTKESI